MMKVCLKKVENKKNQFAIRLDFEILVEKHSMVL